ncbi:MAG: DUF177 domain-containing protein [Nitrospinota bacterium]|nr:DUF177 domain-containing protein [Nitrospinota bacterium]
MKNRTEFVISLQDIREDDLHINSGVDVSLISFEDDHSIELVDINLDGKVSRINTYEYVFKARIGGLCHLSCSICLKVFHFSIDENFRVFFLPPLNDKYHQEDESELVSRDLEISDIISEEIDLFPSIRDHILLSIPVQPRCGEDCSKANSILSPSSDETEIQKIDNRWSALKDFKLKR